MLYSQLHRAVLTVRNPKHLFSQPATKIPHPSNPTPSQPNKKAQDHSKSHPIEIPPKYHLSTDNPEYCAAHDVLRVQNTTNQFINQVHRQINPNQHTMAVLAASICTHGGKALLSRQFKELSKDRITALLANFPSLLSSSGSQNTTVEDEAVRYVYQPLEEFYVVLLTNKQSNILQDIDTLHLFVSVVSNMVRNVDEKEVFDNAFEILSAFDEIVNLGYKEQLTMLQVQTFLEMDSHEEKIQEIIERNKELEASEERRRRAKEIQRKELARRNMEQQAVGFGSGGAGISSQENFGYSAAPPPVATYESARIEQETTPAAEFAAPRPMGSRGLQLGKKPARVAQPEQSQPLLTTKAPVFSNAAPVAAVAEPRASPADSTPVAALAPTPTAPISASASPAPQNSNKPQNNGILVTLNEKVTAQLSREGSLVSSEVKGDLQLRINDSDLAHSKILLQVDHKSKVQYKTHPNVDRMLFTKESIVGLKDKAKSFPSNDQSLGVLRWRAVAASEDTSLVPLLITAWVSVNNGIAEVTLEYELTPQYLEAHPSQELFDDVQILVPIALDDVELRDDPSGFVLYEVNEEGVLFTIAQIPFSDPLGSFEFTIPSFDEDSLFPMEVGFDIVRQDGVTEADTAFGRVQVVDVVTNDADETSLPFDLHLTLASEGFSVN